jgi:hypothetical protein
VTLTSVRYARNGCVVYAHTQQAVKEFVQAQSPDLTVFAFGKGNKQDTAFYDGQEVTESWYYL